MLHLLKRILKTQQLRKKRVSCVKEKESLLKISNVQEKCPRMEKHLTKAYINTNTYKPHSKHKYI